jgi:hypothetical protein
MKTFTLLLTFLSAHVMGLEPPSQTEIDLGPFGPFPNFTPVKREIVCERKPGTDYIFCEYVPQNVKLPEMSIHDAEITEGDYDSKLLKFNVSLSKSSTKEVKVKFGTIDNTAQESQDYESVSGVVVFPAGTVNQEINVTVYGDTLYADEDGTETFFVNLHSVRGANLKKSQAVGTITNDDMTIEESMEDLIWQSQNFYNDNFQQDLWIMEIPIDLQNDGDDDIIFFVSKHINDNVSNSFLVETYPMTYFLNNKGNGFERVDTDIKMWSRFYEVSDVNGDGLDDLISVMDHHKRVVDDQIYREDYVRLLVQTENGELIDSSNSVDKHYADWHGLAVLDIERDGDIDFVASGVHDSIYAFINDGNGNFAKTQSNLPVAELSAFSSTWPGNQKLFHLNLHAVDLNNDGFKEILVGGANDPNQFHLTAPLMPILRNRGGRFEFDYIVDTLDVYLPNQTEGTLGIVDIKDIDINSDGCTDVLMHQTDYQNNTTFITYESDCKGSLNKVFDYRFSKTGWVPRSYVADVTGDGKYDIYGVSNLSQGELELLTNNSDGAYTHSEVDEITHPTFDLATYVRIMLWK